jgi:hypothetical protein
MDEMADQLTDTIFRELLKDIRYNFPPEREGDNIKKSIPADDDSEEDQDKKEESEEYVTEISAS